MAHPRVSSRGVLAGVFFAVASGLLNAAPGDTELVSVRLPGQKSAVSSSADAHVSADGRFIAFQSYAADLVPNDANGVGDVFVRNMQTGAIERISVDSADGEANDHSSDLAISADGRFVAFSSGANDLTAADTNASVDIFVRDRQLGTTERVSVDSSGAQANNASFHPALSSDGRYVAFQSYASNLVIGDGNFIVDIFVHDRQTGSTQRVSVGVAGAAAADSADPSISGDGRYVSFWSFAANLVANDSNAKPDVFLFDRQTGVTERVSVASSGTQANNESRIPSISADGRHVAFWSLASNLVAQDTNNRWDIFVRDRQTGLTERVSVDSSGVQANQGGDEPAISADGRFVTFTSYATNLVTGDSNGTFDVFAHDRQTGATERMNVSTGGTQANADTRESSVSSDGRFVVFTSFASNLVAADRNAGYDVFIRDRQAATLRLVSMSKVPSEAAGGTEPSISADGRYVAFSSYAANLVMRDTNFAMDIFVRDRQTEQNERLTVNSNGVQTNGDSYEPSISADGSDVAFTSRASNVIPGRGNFESEVVYVRDRQSGLTEKAGSQDTETPSISGDGRYVVFQTNSRGHAVYIYDRQTGQTQRASLNSSGGPVPTWEGAPPAVNADGRYVLFNTASKAVPDDSGLIPDVFLHDRQTGQTERISANSSGVKGNAASTESAINGDGRFVAFTSIATNLVTGDSNGFADIFVRDRQTGVTTRVSVDSSGAQANGESSEPAISTDGRYVTFSSTAFNLVAGDTNGAADVFAYDRLTQQTERVSIDSSGAQAPEGGSDPSISADGRFVAFSTAAQLVPSDLNADIDVYVHER